MTVCNVKDVAYGENSLNILFSNSRKLISVEKALINTAHYLSSSKQQTNKVTNWLVNIVLHLAATTVFYQELVETQNGAKRSVNIWYFGTSGGHKNNPKCMTMLL